MPNLTSSIRNNTKNDLAFKFYLVFVCVVVSDSVLKNAVLDPKKMGQRIFVFIIGGATRSELRVCHKLTAKLRREVVLGCTSLDDPQIYLEKLKLLTEPEPPSAGRIPMMF
ncbi:SNARE-interacting protein KEULE [Linum grandiflorum]